MENALNQFKDKHALLLTEIRRLTDRIASRTLTGDVESALQRAARLRSVRDLLCVAASADFDAAGQLLEDFHPEEVGAELVARVLQALLDTSQVVPGRGEAREGKRLPLFEVLQCIAARWQQGGQLRVQVGPKLG